MNPNHLLVRSTTATPTAEDFTCPHGSPLIIDRTGKVTYFLDSTNTVRALNGGTWASVVAAGDIFYGSAANTISSLSIGSAGQILRSTGTFPAWSTLTFPNTITRGGLFYGSASNVASVLAVGSATHVLTSDGTDVSWAAPAVPSTVTVADTTDSTCFVSLFESATGNLAPKTDLGLTYNASSPALTCASFVGDLTGNAATVTTADAGAVNARTLLHFDGSDASTTFTDSGTSPVTFTASGNAQLDTAQFKFGTASLLCDGTGDYARGTIGARPSGSWTVQGWVRFNALPAATNFYIVNWGLASPERFAMSLRYSTSSNQWFFGVSSNGTSFDIAAEQTLTTGSASTGTWYHWAVTYDGSTYRAFIAGTQGASVSSATLIHSSSTELTIGASQGSSPIANLDGWIDEVAFLHEALWTANFTPPTVPYTAATHYLMLATAVSGSLYPRTDVGLTYNPASDTLTAGTFSGTFSGTASVATTVTVADTTDSTCSVALFESATGDLGAKTDAGITYDASTGTFALPTNGSSAGITVGSLPIRWYYDNGTGWSRIAAGAGAYGITSTSFGWTNSGDPSTANLMLFSASGPTFYISGATPTISFQDGSHVAYTQLAGNSVTQNVEFSDGIYVASLIELGHATDTTITRSSAGVIAVEGVDVAMVSTGVTWANEATDTTCFIGFATAASGLLSPKTNANMTFNSNTGVATFGQTIVGSVNGNAGTATALQNARTIGGTSFDGTANIVPATITAANEGTDTTCFPTFFTAATGDLGPKTNASLTFNSNTGALGSTSITVGNTGLTVGASVPFSDSSGTLTLQNVDALDATTKATIEAAIDTLANLTSIQGLTVTLADAGADAFIGWDDSASAYENLTKAEAQAVLGLATSSTDNAVVRFDSTGGNTQDSGVIIDDSNNITGVVALTATGVYSVTTNGQKFVCYEDDVATTDAFFELSNGTSGAGIFQPLLRMRSNRTGATSGSQITGDAINDTASEAASPCLIVSGRSNNSTVTNRPLFGVQNVTSNHFAIREDGTTVCATLNTAQTIGQKNRLQSNGNATTLGGLGLSHFAASAVGPKIEMSKSRSGTTGTNTIVQSGDTVGSITCYGANGTTYDPAAQIIAEIAGTPGTSADMPGRWRFLTTPDGSATPLDRLWVDSDGSLQQYALFTSSTNYSRVAHRFETVTLTSVSGATVTATNLIPARANVMGVNTKVTVALGTGGGTTGYKVGDGTDDDIWGAVTGTATTTDTDGNDATANPAGTWATTARNVVITAVGGNFNGTGSIRIDVFYWITEAD